MGRQERPLDPQASDLARFAHDLRLARVAAGNPTYRALARTTGYSTTTLSEAAGGTRRPSLDVTLAYARAVGADPGHWRTRWTALTPPGTAAEALRSAPDPAEPADGTDSATAGAPAEAAPVAACLAARRKRRWRPAVAAAGVLLIAAGVTGLSWGRRTGVRANAKPATVTGCPGVTGRSLFTGTTKADGVRKRGEPLLNAVTLGNLPPGCTVGFTGYCLGDKVVDPTSGTPDVRWFELTTGGVVASAMIHGNPPTALGPSECPGALAAPATIRLTATATTLTATGATIPGYAYADSQHQWHQIAFGTPSASWHPTAPTLIVADACLGGDGPTAVAAFATARPTGLTPVPPPASSADAERAACRYPS